MKKRYVTVQEYLRSQEMSVLAREYCERYDKKVYELSKDDEAMSICNIKKRREEQVISYLKHLLLLVPKENEDRMIFYAQKCAIDRFNTAEVCVLLSSLDEMITKGTKAECYGYALTSQKKMLGFYLSEDPYTKRHMDEVIQDILYEMSFFGWQEENKAAVLQELDEIDEEIENGTLKTVSVSQDEFRKLCEIEPEDVDPQAEELRRAIQTQIFAYNDYHRTKQINAVMELYC